jgi:nucleoside-diphosphate-sugar epimerase
VKVLVTGGGGFLGAAICATLAAAGHRVRVLSRRPLPDPADVVLGDLHREQDVADAVAGCDAVVHCAARTGVWGDRAGFHRTNVTGTRHVIAACRRHGVDRLVYTSSPSVVHAGRNLRGVAEDTPYPRDFRSPYPESKAAAERLVLAANGPDLGTVALRPHLVWGPGDPHFVPRFVDQARRGRLTLIGDGSSLVDTVYVDNAADAHLAALELLRPGAEIGGCAYFIAQGEPRPVRDTIAMWVAAAGVTPEFRSVGTRTAYTLATAAETVWRLGRLTGDPPLTRFLVEQLSTDHWFDLGAARRDLGYVPRVSTDQGLDRLRAALSNDQRGNEP